MQVKNTNIAFKAKLKANEEVRRQITRVFTEVFPRYEKHLETVLDGFEAGTKDDCPEDIVNITRIDGINNPSFPLSREDHTRPEDSAEPQQRLSFELEYNGRRKEGSLDFNSLYPDKFVELFIKRLIETFRNLRIDERLQEEDQEKHEKLERLLQRLA